MKKVQTVTIAGTSRILAFLNYVEENGQYTDWTGLQPGELYYGVYLLDVLFAYGHLSKYGEAINYAIANCQATYQECWACDWKSENFSSFEKMGIGSFYIDTNRGSVLFSEKTAAMWFEQLVKRAAGK